MMLTSLKKAKNANVSDAQKVSQSIHQMSAMHGGRCEKKCLVWGKSVASSTKLDSCPFIHSKYIAKNIFIVLKKVSFFIGLGHEMPDF